MTEKENREVSENWILVDKAYSEVSENWIYMDRPVHKPNESSTREELIKSLDAMEECTRIVEIESKAWHDAWVVRRQIVRALWLILTWIVKQIDRKEK